MGHTLNRKLLLTLTTLAYAFNSSTLQASKLNDEESFSDRAFNTVKSGAYGAVKMGAYGATAAATFVAGVTAYEAERETFLHAKNQMIHYSCEAGFFLADNVGKFCNLTSWAFNEAYTEISKAYMPYHPAVCQGVSEIARLSSEGFSALQQTVTDHPYVSAGVAVAFAASIGIAYLYGKNKASHATKLLAEKEAAALKDKRRIEAENERLEKQVKELQSAQTQRPTSIVTETHPRSKSDNNGRITSNPIVHGGQGGNVTLNIMMPPEMMKGGSSPASSLTVSSKTPQNVILIED